MKISSSSTTIHTLKMASNTTTSPAPSVAPSPAPSVAPAPVSHFDPDSWTFDPEDVWSVPSRMHLWEKKMLAYENRIGKRFPAENVRFAREMELLKLCGDD